MEPHPVQTITTPIGMAVWTPPIPTSGETIPPSANDVTPNKADALLAFFPCVCIAREKPDVFTIPTLDTTKNNGINKKTNLPVKI